MLPQSKPIHETSPYMPSLSTHGWITGMNEKIDRIFSYYVTSQHSQTVYHLGHVRSLQYTVQKYYQDPMRLAKQIKEDLETLLNGYIDYVDIDVTYKARETGPEVDYTINLTLVHAGYRWNGFKSIETNGSIFKVLMDINNQGVSLA